MVSIDWQRQKFSYIFGLASCALSFVSTVVALRLGPVGCASMWKSVQAGSCPEMEIPPIASTKMKMEMEMLIDGKVTKRKTRLFFGYITKSRTGELLSF